MSYVEEVFAWAEARNGQGGDTDLSASIMAVRQASAQSAAFGTGDGTLSYTPGQTLRTGTTIRHVQPFYQGIVTIQLDGDGTTHGLMVRIQPPVPPLPIVVKPGDPVPDGGGSTFVVSIEPFGPNDYPPVLIGTCPPGGTQDTILPSPPAGGSALGPAPAGAVSGLFGTSIAAAPGQPITDNEVAVVLYLSAADPAAG